MWKEPSSLRSTRRLWICRDLGVGSDSEGLSRGPSSCITQEHMITWPEAWCLSSHSDTKPGSCVCASACVCHYRPHTFRLMRVSRMVISIGRTWEVESSARKMARLRRDDMRKSALKACSWHCRKPLRSASGERAAASGPFSSRRRTSGSRRLVQGCWSEAEPDTHIRTHARARNLNHQQPVVNNEECKSSNSTARACNRQQVNMWILIISWWPNKCLSSFRVRSDASAQIAYLKAIHFCNIPHVHYLHLNKKWQNDILMKHGVFDWTPWFTFGNLRNTPWLVHDFFFFLEKVSKFSKSSVCFGFFSKMSKNERAMSSSAKTTPVSLWNF